MTENDPVKSDRTITRKPETDQEGARLPVEFDARLVEDAVGFAMQGRPETTYWQRREKIYSVEDSDEKDRAFGLLNRTEFESLALAGPIYRALDEQPLIAANVERCRVMGARSLKEEEAELFVAPARPGEPVESEPATLRAVVLRLTPQAFLIPERLLDLLRHELQHIADMLDPAFGYDPRPPEVEGDPARLKLILHRYRVLWDTTIDGRLWRLGRARRGVRHRRDREFADTFSMLGSGCGDAFTEWFEVCDPTHASLMRFAFDPLAARGVPAPVGGAVAICPLCRCPGIIDVELARTLTASAIEEILREFPHWRVTDGACPQCVELYRARPLSRAAADALPRTSGESTLLPPDRQNIGRASLASVLPDHDPRSPLLGSGQSSRRARPAGQSLFPPSAAGNAGE